MKVMFKYSIDFGDGVQHHEREIVVEVPGSPEGKGAMEPSYQQLRKAEESFHERFKAEHPEGRLLMFVAIPADGTKARFAEYRAFMAV